MPPIVKKFYGRYWGFYYYCYFLCILEDAFQEITQHIWTHIWTHISCLSVHLMNSCSGLLSWVNLWLLSCALKFQVRFLDSAVAWWGTVIIPGSSMSHCFSCSEWSTVTCIQAVSSLGVHTLRSPDSLSASASFYSKSWNFALHPFTIVCTVHVLRSRFFAILHCW